MFQEKRKQGLAFWIECPWGEGREAGLVQIKLMLLMDLVPVEMGAAVSQQQQNRRGREGLPGSGTHTCLCLGGTPDFPFPEEGRQPHLAGSPGPSTPLNASLDSLDDPEVWADASPSSSGNGRCCWAAGHVDPFQRIPSHTGPLISSHWRIRKKERQARGGYSGLRKGPQDGPPGQKEHPLRPASDGQSSLTGPSWLG